MDAYCEQCDEFIDPEEQEVETCGECGRIICENCQAMPGAFAVRCADKEWCAADREGLTTDIDPHKRLKLKQPCNDCPFRRKAIPGWLGADTPQGFLEKTEAGVQMPCHQTVDYESKDWEEQSKEAPLCAGALIYLANSGKVRDLGLYPLPDWVTVGLPVVKQGVEQLGKDMETVFQWKHEFIQHHSQGSLAAYFDRKREKEFER